MQVAGNYNQDEGGIAYEVKCAESNERKTISSYLP